MKLGHIGIPVKNIQVCKQFYDAIVSVVSLEFIDCSGSSVRYGERGSARLYFHTREEAVSGVHICFDVENREQVDEFYKNALENGGTEHGAPGVREDYSPNYYAAFVLDPDGNNIEAVCRN